MKPTSQILILWAALLAVSCTSRTDLLTVVNPDGSCYRQFTRTVDSAFMCGDTTDAANRFPIKVDSSCTVSWNYGESGFSSEFPLSKVQYDSVVNSVPADSSKIMRSFEAVVRQDFPSVEEMGRTFRFKPEHEWSRMKVKASLQKKFRWFYTYYNYREIYPKIEINISVPLEKYMSKDEARFWFTGEPNILQGMNGIEIREYMGNLEDQYNQWATRNIWDAYYVVLLANYDSISNPPVTKDRLAILKDSILEAGGKNFDDFKMEKTLNKYFHTTVFSELWKTENSPMSKFDTEFSEQPFVKYSSKSFTYTLILPGKVITSNNGIVNGHKLVWTLTAERMMYDDYALDAQSRKPNIWAFLLSGVVVVIAICSFLYKPGRRTRK